MLKLFQVGGSIRDELLGISPKDIDFATPSTPEEILAFAKSNGIKAIPTGIAHGTVTLVLPEGTFEITTFRKDITTDGRHATVEWAKTIEEDLSRRDFTINAMAKSPEGELIDPFGGQTDLKNKLIRTVGNPTQRFTEDKLRILRAIRFATVLDFEIEENTFEAIHQSSLDGISPERIRDELTKILSSPNRIRGILLLDQSGILSQILPELSHTKTSFQLTPHHPEGDVFTHTLLTLNNLPNPSLEEIFSALLHDVGKTSTGEHFHDHENSPLPSLILTRLKFPTQTLETITWLVSNHMKLHHFAEIRTAKKIRLMSEPLFPSLLKLFTADVMGSDKDTSKITKVTNFTAPKPKQKFTLINGFDITNLGIPPGPKIGELLTFVEDLFLEGTISTKEEALAIIKEVKK